MGEGQVRVRWSGFGGAVCSWVSTLKDSALLADVTVMAGGRSLRAHRLVLAASSALFRDIFQQNPMQHAIIVLQDISFAALCTIVSYIYNGEVNVTEEFLPTFIKAAEKLQVIGLAFPLSEDEESMADNDVNGRSPTPSIENFIKTEIDTESYQIDQNEEIQPADVLEMETIIKEEVDSGNENFEHTNLARCDNQKKRTSKRSKKKIKSKRFKADIVEKCLKKMNKENESYSSIISNNTTDPPQCEKNLTDYCDDMESVLGSNIIETLNNVCDDQNDSCLNADLNKDENTRPTFPCPFCGRVYYSWGYRRRHVKTHHESNSLSCKLCMKTMNSEVTWFDHVVNVHGVPHAQARDSLVIMVEAHSVLTFSSPPSAVTMLHHLQLEGAVNSLNEETAMLHQEQAAAN